jgi:hypothetical protein
LLQFPLPGAPNVTHSLTISFIKITFQKEEKSLKNLSVDVLFQDIVSRLKLSLLKFEELNKTNSLAVNLQDYSPPAKKKRIASLNDARLNRNLIVIETIRAELDEYLVSSYSQVRWKLFQRFLTTYRSKEHTLFLSFLNSVMDHSFTTCSLIRSKQFELNLPEGQELLNVICSRSPLLQSLHISFNMVNPSKFDSLKIGDLNNFTSLSLSLQTSCLCINLFSSIGKSCPRLASLHIAGALSFGVYQALTLILGDARHTLSVQVPKQAAAMVDVQLSPSVTLNPICFSLKHLLYDSDDIYGNIECYCPPIAFVLRHFPKLEKLECSTCKHFKTSKQIENTAASVIVYWHEKQLIRKSLRLQEKRTNTARKNSKESGKVNWIINSPFNGNPLNLLQLYCNFIYLFHLSPFKKVD